MMEAVFERVPKAEVFARTGIQFMQLNTLFQLFAHVREGLPKARHAPAAGARSHRRACCPAAQSPSSPSGRRPRCSMASTGTWDDELLGRLGIPRDLLCEVVPSGTRARSPPAGGGRRDRADGRRAGRARRPRHGKRRGRRAAPAGLGLHLVGDLVARRRRAARRPDQRRGRAPQLHQRGRRLRHDAVPQERDGAVDPRIVPARVERTRGCRSTTTTCCSGPPRSTASPASSIPDDPRFLNPPSMLAAIAEQMRRDGPGGPVRPARRRQGDPRLAGVPLCVRLPARSKR